VTSEKVHVNGSGVRASTNGRSSDALAIKNRNLFSQASDVIDCITTEDESDDDDTLVASRSSSGTQSSLDHCKSLDQLGDLLMKKTFVEDFRKPESYDRLSVPEATLLRKAAEQILGHGAQAGRGYNRFSLHPNAPLPHRGHVPVRPGQLIMG
jgi:hypothetical protein